jgi:hypothetical protein
MGAENVVRCSEPDCAAPACYKIAAPWTDGRYRELKTYGFACDEHVRDVLRSAEVRWLDYEPVRGESVYPIAIYRYQPGTRDSDLARDHDIEGTLNS